MIIETIKSPSKRFTDFEEAHLDVGQHEFETVGTRLSDLSVNGGGRLVVAGRELEPAIETFSGQLLKAAKLPRGTFNANVPHDDIREFVNAGLVNTDNGRVSILLLDGSPYMIFPTEGDDIVEPFTPNGVMEVVARLVNEENMYFSQAQWNMQGMRILLLNREHHSFTPDENYVIGLELLGRWTNFRVCSMLQQHSCTNSTIMAGNGHSFVADFGPNPSIVYDSAVEWGKQFTVDMQELGVQVRSLKEEPFGLPVATSVVEKTTKAAGQATAARVLTPFVRTTGDRSPKFVKSDTGNLHLTERGNRSDLYDVWYEITRQSQNLASLQKRIKLEELAYQFLNGTISEN
jgi:hypothetical protein